MNTYNLLIKRINKINSFLCIGLDPDKNLLNNLNLKSTDLFLLNKLIIDSTYQYATAYKPQFAHYAALGQEKDLEQTCKYIKEKYPDIVLILDSKRGDIGNTAKKYAQESYLRYYADAVTVNPYMGLDTLQPYLEYEDKAIIVLIKTSNPGSFFIQDLKIEPDNKRLYLYIAEKLSNTYSDQQLWFVVGGTKIKAMKEIRTVCPNNIFLVPGIGVQGGKISDIIKNGRNKANNGILINVSRGITSINKKIDNLYLYSQIIKQNAQKYYLEIKKIYNQK